MAVVHQRISQLSSSGLMNIESSHKLTRSGDTASGCIEGVNMEDYQVGVVGGTQVVLVSGKYIHIHLTNTVEVIMISLFQRNQVVLFVFQLVQVCSNFTVFLLTS